MTLAITFTEADTELMVVIISQLGVGKIDMKRLQQDLNLKGGSTASVRLSRFRAKLAKATEQGSVASPLKDKQASPDKRKAAKDDENEEDTPRKMPGRKARVVSLKEEADEDGEIDLLDMAGDDEE